MGDTARLLGPRLLLAVATLTVSSAALLVSPIGPRSEIKVALLAIMMPLLIFGLLRIARPMMGAAVASPNPRRMGEAIGTHLSPHAGIVVVDGALLLQDEGRRINLDDARLLLSPRRTVVGIEFRVPGGALTRVYAFGQRLRGIWSDSA